MNDDLQTAITTFFVNKREHGTTLSSADTQYLLRLQQKNAPIHVVIEGIEQAFRSKKDPPLSLSDCKRWINAALKKSDGPAVAEQFSGANNDTSRPDSSTDRASAQLTAPNTASTSPTIEQRLLQRLRTLRNHTPVPAAQAACDELIDEFVALTHNHDGTLPPDTINVLDDALIQLLFKHDQQAFNTLDIDAAAVADLELRGDQRHTVLAHFGLGSILAI